MRRLEQLHREHARARLELQRMMRISSPRSGVDGTNDNDVSAGEQGIETNLHPNMLAWMEELEFMIVSGASTWLAQNNNANRPREWTTEERRQMLEMVVECQPYLDQDAKLSKEAKFFQSTPLADENDNGEESKVDEDCHALAIDVNTEEAGTTIHTHVESPFYFDDGGSSCSDDPDKKDNSGVNYEDDTIINDQSSPNLPKIGNDDDTCYDTERISNDVIHKGELIEEEDFENSCAICLDEFVDGQLLNVSKKCPHVFHKECLFLWLEKHDVCPFCRTVLVTPVDLENASEQLLNTTATNESHDDAGGNSSHDDADVLVEGRIIDDDENETSIIMEERNNDEQIFEAIENNSSSLELRAHDAPQSEIDSQSRLEIVNHNENEGENSLINV